jgi:uncharacterized integral membrane protein
MRFLKNLIIILFFFLIILFSISNTQLSAIYIPIINYNIETPLFVIVLTSVIIGILITMIISYEKIIILKFKHFMQNKKITNKN